MHHEQILSNANIGLQQFYRSPELFETYLLNQEKVDITPWPFDFQIGNAQAPCQLVVVSSHSCGPCLETHEILQKLLKKHKGQLGITVRFLDTSKEIKEGTKGDIARHMLMYALSTEHFLQDPQQVEQMLHTWYSVSDIEKFSKLYPLAEDIEVEKILEQQREWSKSVNIQFTPTIFINGYKLKDPYTRTDLLEFSSTILELFSTEEAHYTPYVDHTQSLQA